MDTKFSPIKLFARVSILLMSFILFLDACSTDNESTYKIKLIEESSNRYGAMTFERLDSRYEQGDTLTWNDYLYVIIKKMNP